MYKIYSIAKSKLYTTRTIPPGYIDDGYTGEGSALKSIKILGNVPSSNINNLDLGVARVNIKIEGGKAVLEFVHGVDANVGSRRKTVGQGVGQIPIWEWEKAKAKGIKYNQFVSNYTGELVGENENNDDDLDDRITSIYDIDGELTPNDRAWYRDEPIEVVSGRKRKHVKILDPAEKYYRGHRILPSELGGNI